LLVIPALIDNAADEMILLVTPVRHFLRHALQVTLGRFRFRAGDRVLLSYLSANRDESKFE